MRCGLAAVFPSRCFFGFLAFDRISASKFRIMRIGRSLRTHRRIAIDAVTVSLAWRINPAACILQPRHRGNSCIKMRPITALRNPATIQGRMKANNRSAARSGACSKEVMASHSPAAGADYGL